MNNSKYVWRMTKYFFRNKKATFYSILMCIIGLAVGLFTPIANSYIQNEIIPNKNISLFVILTIVILILNFASILSAYFNTKIMVDNSVPITANIRRDIVKMNTFSNKNKQIRGIVSISSTQFLEDANGYYISYLNTSYDSLLKFMFFFPFFIASGKKLALIMIASLAFYFALVNVISIYSQKCADKSREADKVRYEYLLKMTKALQQADFEENDEISYLKYKEVIKNTEKAWIKYCLVNNIFDFTRLFIWYGMFGLTCILAYHSIEIGAMSVGAFVVYHSYFSQLDSPLSQFVNFIKNCNQNNMTFKNIFISLDDEELLDLKKDISWFYYDIMIYFLNYLLGNKLWT